MRTIVLIAAMVLASASAQAGDSRSLTTGPDTSAATTAPNVQQTSVVSQDIKPVADQHAYNDTPTTTGATTYTTTTGAAPADTGKVADTGKTDAPRYSAPTSTQTTSTQTTSTDSGTTTKSSYDDEPRRSSYERRARAEYSAYRHGRWTADRVIGELHRHGVYW